MPRRIIEFDSPDRFVAGAVGQPGQRTFFLQASQAGSVVSVVLEKAQIAALAERLAALLAELRDRGIDVAGGSAGSARDDAPLAEPIAGLFRVGMLTLAWDGTSRRVVIEARELVEGDDEPDDEDEDGDAGDGPDTVRVLLAPHSAAAFAERAAQVVAAGRPPCPVCGLPLNPEGHICPRRNGYIH